MMTASQISVSVQPRNQTPMATNAAIGMPGNRANQNRNPGIQTFGESSRRATSTSVMTSATIAMPSHDTGRKGSTPCLSASGVSGITCQEG